MIQPHGSKNVLFKKWQQMRPILQQHRTNHSTRCAMSSTAATMAEGQLFRIHESVREALRHGRPVVALESTIVAHGMPYPENLQLSQNVAAILRDRGVEPATIGMHAKEKEHVMNSSIHPYTILIKLLIFSTSFPLNFSGQRWNLSGWIDGIRIGRLGSSWTRRPSTKMFDPRFRADIGTSCIHFRNQREGRL
jgi:hypothetical protein